MARIVLPDTSLLRNFNAVDRLDLIERFCAKLAPAWAAEVAQECERQGLATSTMGNIFGEPEWPTASQMTNALQLRQDFFPTKHGNAHGRREDMGECVTFAIWADKASLGEAFFMLTEDRAVVQFCHATQRSGSRAAQFMSGRKPVAVTTADVLGALTVQQVLTADAATTIKRDMLDLGRPIVGPAKEIS